MRLFQVKLNVLWTSFSIFFLFFSSDKWKSSYHLKKNILSHLAGKPTNQLFMESYAAVLMYYIFYRKHFLQFALLSVLSVVCPKGLP